MIANLLWLVVHMINVAVSSSSVETTSKLQGHLQKLGSHRDPMGVTMIGKFSDPTVFFYQFIRPGKPLYFRGVLSQVDHPGLKNWTDDYFR